MVDNPTTRDDSERAPLLARDGPQHVVKRTPLPLKQISILLFLNFCEFTARYSVLPFLNELLLSLNGGDETTVPYYASVMEAGRRVSFLVMIIYWGRISDYLGRKPILLLSCAAVGSSIFLVGISTSFWMLVVSRCISGGLSSNAGIIKTAIAEMTDDTNRADAFAMLNIPWSMGMSIGPLIGGWLSNPQKHFPRAFSGKLWRDFPYLLPCATIALGTFIAFLVASIYFRETLPHKRNSSTSVESTATTTQPHKPPPLRTLLTDRVLLSVSIYAAIDFVTMAFLSIQPLFLAMPIEVGGIALEPTKIGSILGFFGLCDAITGALVLGPLIRQFGLRRVLRIASSASIPIFLLYPLMNIYAKEWQVHQNAKPRVIMYILLTIQLVLLFILNLGYGCILIYITSSAPNKRSLGSVNGIAQMAVAVTRLTGPTFGTVILGLSIERGWMGGYAVYYASSFMAVGGVLLAGMLPESAWATASTEEY